MANILAPTDGQKVGPVIRGKAKGPRKRNEDSKKPWKWDVAVSAAYLRLLGETNEDAATQTGCGERTLRTWQKTKWWPKALAEARGRWLQGVESGAMRGVLEGLGDPNEYAAMARWAAERVVPELSPPKQKLEHTGKDGAPIKTEEVITSVERKARIAVLLKVVNVVADDPPAGD